MISEKPGKTRGGEEIIKGLSEKSVPFQVNG
jgi:hypothetical protein